MAGRAKGAEQSFTHREVIKLANVSSRELIYLAERAVVRPSLGEAQGRGSSRRYSLADLAEVRLAKLLRTRGYEVRTVGAIIALVRAFLDEVSKVRAGGTLPASLGDITPKTKLRLVVGDGAFVFFDTEQGRTPVGHLAATGKVSIRKHSSSLVDGFTDFHVIDLAKACSKL